LAALTVVVSPLNVRRQADAANHLEHAKWLREKRDGLLPISMMTVVAASPDPQ
jgi:hypothetical protein